MTFKGTDFHIFARSKVSRAMAQPSQYLKNQNVVCCSCDQLLY